MKEEITVAKIVELKNVTKVYKTGEREFRALDGVDLSIEKESSLSYSARRERANPRSSI